MEIGMLGKQVSDKYEKLVNCLKELGSVAVAFSGGVDSTLLLSVAKDVLGENTAAVIAKSAFIPEQELEDAVEFAEKLGVRYEVLNMDILKVEGVAENPQNRCYICKKAIFTNIMGKARSMGLEYVAEGSNMDDIGDYRPGAVAVKELEVRSPLQEAELYKDEIRQISKELALPTWNKPSMACLASRFVYGESITEKGLKRVELAERILMNLGYKQLRVRCHGDLARIEVEVREFDSIMEPERRILVYDEFTKLGFNYVTVDLKGYQMGSMNKMLSEK